MEIKCFDMSMKEIKPENIQLTDEQAKEIAQAFIDNGILEYIRNHRDELKEFIEN